MAKFGPSLLVPTPNSYTRAAVGTKNHEPLLREAESDARTFKDFRVSARVFSDSSDSSSGIRVILRNGVDTLCEVRKGFLQPPASAQLSSIYGAFSSEKQITLIIRTE